MRRQLHWYSSVLFNSPLFIFLFLPFVLAVSIQLRGTALLRWITISSCAFYACAGHAWFLLPMLFTTVLDFVLAPLMASTTGARRKCILMVSLAGNLGLLFFFKYFGLLSVTFGLGKLWSFALPAGISFYTFQTLSYMIDIYRGVATPERNFWRFASFVTFFPHLVAGPLTRHNQLIPQLESIESTGPLPKWSAGIFLFTLGLAKKVLIADRVANLIDPLIGRPYELTTITAWMCLIGYSLQIYFDFSGYSDMAIGLGRLFGIELPQNFRSPYQAENPSDFWRRWHITLSTWLRDYLYISLGGGRCGPVRHLFNLMVTMVLGGLWHGANWTFGVWGLYHGLLLVAYQLGGSFWNRMPKAFRQVGTYFLITIGWIFFRSDHIMYAKAWIFAAIHKSTYWSTAKWGLELVVHSSDLQILLALIAVSLGIAFLAPRASTFDGYDRLNRGRQICLGLIAVASLVIMNYSSRFLYFQF